MVVPTVGLVPGSPKGTYAEAATRLGAVSAQSLNLRDAVGRGQVCGLVAACSNNAFEFASACAGRPNRYAFCPPLNAVVRKPGLVKPSRDVPVWSRSGERIEGFAQGYINGVGSSRIGVIAFRGRKSWSSQQKGPRRSIGKTRTLKRLAGPALFRNSPSTQGSRTARAIHAARWWPVLTTRSSSLRPTAFAGRPNRYAFCPPLNAVVRKSDSVATVMRCWNYALSWQLNCGLRSSGFHRSRCMAYRRSSDQEKDLMVIPTAASVPGSPKGAYAEAANRTSTVSAQSLNSRVAVGRGQACGLVAVCSNNAFEYAAAYGLRRTVKPLRVLSAAQRGR